MFFVQAKAAKSRLAGKGQIVCSGFYFFVLAAGASTQQTNAKGHQQKSGLRRQEAPLSYFRKQGSKKTPCFFIKALLPFGDE
jgi:hypothetical protein